MNSQSAVLDELLTPAAAAAILFVHPKTVSRWAQAGKINSIRTPSGHRRFLKSDVQALVSGLRGQGRPAGPSAAPPARTPAPRGTETRVDAAAAVVAEAVAIALEAEATAAADEARLIVAATTAAAEKAAIAAAKARGARAYAATEAARVVAGNATSTATALQIRAEAAAALMAESTDRAMEVIAAYDPQDSDRGATLIATRFVTTIRYLANTAACETALAATAAADAVAAAAAELASIVSTVERSFDAEVNDTADALEEVTTATMRRLAATTEARAAGAAITARHAAAALHD